MKYIKISKWELEEDQFGHKMIISRVGIYDENLKFIKWIKIKEFSKILESGDYQLIINE